MGQLTCSGDCADIEVSYSSFYKISNIQDNSLGGAILIMQYLNVHIYDCLFFNCVAGKSGGAAYIINELRNYNSVYIYDKPIHNGTVENCCFYNCYCNNNNRGGSVLVLSAENLIFRNTNAQKCNGYDINIEKMEVGQISLLGYDDIISQFFNTSEGNSIYCSGIEIFYATKHKFGFMNFKDMVGTFVTYFQYMIDINFSFSNYINITITDPDQGNIIPGVIFTGVGDLYVENCIFILIDFVKSGQLAIYGSYDSAYNYVIELYNCSADKIYFPLDHVVTNYCKFGVGGITPNLFNVFECRLFSFPYTQSYEFTNSLQSSESKKFTKSDDFTNTKQFTLSDPLTMSFQFTKSKDFSYSQTFSESGKFTNSDAFTYSDLFTDSTKFTISDQFTESNIFSKSKQFSCSSKFSKSNEFTDSGLFTNSQIFTLSDPLTMSFQFTKSKDFSYSQTFSESGKFTNSDAFTYSDLFTDSNKFSISNQFTHSNKFTISNQFTHSNKFTISNQFTHSNKFTISNQCTHSNKFTISNQFTDSKSSGEISSIDKYQSQGENMFSFTFSDHQKIFTNSVQFTYSQIFSFSSILTDKFIPTLQSEKVTPNYTSLSSQSQNDPLLTFSQTITLTLMMRRSVSFSITCSISYFYSMVYIPDDGTYSYILTKSDFYYYMPYIITVFTRYHSPTYIQFYPYRKKGITKEQLIGISCISTSIFFFILGVIIVVVKRRYRINSDLYDYSTSSSAILKARQNNTNGVEQETKNDSNILSDSSDTDLNFWL